MNVQTPNQAKPEYDDEIDLFELWQTIWSQKWMIAALTFSLTFFAAVASLLMSKTYQTEIHILPPQASQVASITFDNLSKFGISSPTSQSIYKEFLDQLSASETINQLLKQPHYQNHFLHQKQFTESNIVKHFDKNLTITPPQEPKEKLVFKPLTAQVSYQSSDPEMTLNLLLDFIKTADHLTKQAIRDNLLKSLGESYRLIDFQYQIENQRINREIEAEITRLKEADELKRKEIEQKIQLAKEKAKRDRQYRIERLESDLQIAQALGIETPVNPLDYNRQVQNITKVDVSSKDPSRYWLGTKTLEQEIQNLKTRKNDDAFIGELSELYKSLKELENNNKIEVLQSRDNNFPFSDELRKLKTELDTLEEIKRKIQSAEFEVYRVSKEPIKPETAIKPKKKLIVAVAFVLSGMLGIFIALIRGAIQKRRQNQTVV